MASTQHKKDKEKQIDRTIEASHSSYLTQKKFLLHFHAASQLKFFYMAFSISTFSELFLILRKRVMHTSKVIFKNSFLGIGKDFLNKTPAAQ
jgi:hypothetical protein